MAVVDPSSWGALVADALSTGRRADGTRENGEDVDLLNQTDEQY